MGLHTGLNFKVAIINVFKGLKKKNMFEELQKKSMTITH